MSIWKGQVGIVLTELGADFLLGSVAANLVVDRRRQSCVGQSISANHVRADLRFTPDHGGAQPPRDLA